MKGPALAVMARAPIPGQAKTRLQPELTAEQCSTLSLALLKDAIELATSLPQYTPFLAFTPHKERRFFENLVTGKMQLVSQSGGDLGRRMYRLMNYLETSGYSPVVLIGTDIPTLQPATLLQAIQVLQYKDLCLGPSRDGGYYLIGATRSEERIFKGMAWSTPRVLKDTMQKAKDAGLPLALLEEYADVDTFADLQRTCLDINRLHNTPGARVPVHTEAWLKENG